MAAKEQSNGVADQNTENPGQDAGQSGNRGGTAVRSKPSRKASPAKKPTQPLPPWKVLLHNSDDPTFEYVIETIVSLTPLNQQDAKTRTKEANDNGVALLLTTHRERAELYQEQFQSKGLVVTIEPAE